jgi:hypothetical protein
MNVIDQHFSLKSLLIRAFILVSLTACNTQQAKVQFVESPPDMGALSALELPSEWQPIADRDVWDDLQFSYPATNKLVQQYNMADCKALFINPGQNQIREGTIGSNEFHTCIGGLIARSGSEPEYQQVFVDALLNWSSMDSDPWRDIPAKPYIDSKPWWYQSTSNMAVVTSWYAINRNIWPLSTDEKEQIDKYLQAYFAWVDFDTVTERGRLPCAIGNPAATARKQVDTDTCGSVRMKGVSATLSLALATGHRPTYEQALRHLKVIFHQFDDEGFFVPYMAPSKQGWAFSYYFEVARFLSTWVELYKTVNVDLLSYRMPAGATVADALSTAFRVTKDHKLLGKYEPEEYYNYGGNLGSDWKTVSQMSQEEFEGQPRIYGAWDFVNNDARFALHNPRFSVEKLGLEPPWEKGYDKFHHSDFHSIQPAHLYLANAKGLSVSTSPIDYFDGRYELNWSIRNMATGKWQPVSSDVLEVKGFEVDLFPNQGPPGDAAQRKALMIRLDSKGMVRMNGVLGLFDTERSYPTRLKGSLVEGFIEGVWHDGDLIRATVKRR